MDGYSVFPNTNCKIICEDCVDAKGKDFSAYGLVNNNSPLTKLWQFSTATYIGILISGLCCSKVSENGPVQFESSVGPRGLPDASPPPSHWRGDCSCFLVDCYACPPCKGLSSWQNWIGCSQDSPHLHPATGDLVYPLQDSNTTIITKLDRGRSPPLTLLLPPCGLVLGLLPFDVDFTPPFSSSPLLLPMETVGLQLRMPPCQRSAPSTPYPRVKDAKLLWHSVPKRWSRAPTNHRHHQLREFRHHLREHYIPYFGATHKAFILGQYSHQYSQSSLRLLPDLNYVPPRVQIPTKWLPHHCQFYLYEYKWLWPTIFEHVPDVWRRPGWPRKSPPPSTSG